MLITECITYYNLDAFVFVCMFCFTTTAAAANTNQVLGSAGAAMWFPEPGRTIQRKTNKSKQTNKQTNTHV